MTVREFIKIMGGRAYVSDIFRVSPRAVGHWYFKGVPSSCSRWLQDVARERGYSEYTVKFISELETE